MSTGRDAVSQGGKNYKIVLKSRALQKLLIVKTGTNPTAETSQENTHLETLCQKHAENYNSSQVRSCG